MNWFQLTPSIIPLLLHILVEIHLCTPESIRFVCHLLSNDSLLSLLVVHVSCCDWAYTWNMFALRVLFRIADAREKCWNEVVWRSTLPTISSSHHSVASALRSHNLLIVPFEGALVGSVVTINALIEEILGDSLIIAMIISTHEVSWSCLLLASLHFVIACMINIVWTFILIAIKLDFQVIVYKYTALPTALTLIELSVAF